MRVPKFLLPEIPTQVKCQVKCPKGKKPIVATKLPKLQGSEERENRNCGNQVAEMLGRNLIVILARDWRKIKKKKRKKKKEEWWQLICDNGIAEMEGKKKKKRIVAMELPKIKGERKYLIGILVCQKKKFLWH